MAKDDKDASEEPKGLGGVLLGAAVLALVIGLVAFAQMREENVTGGRELPHGVIQIDVAKFDQPTRTRLLQLETSLKGMGFLTFGPGSQKFLVPGAKPMDTPVAKGFADLTDDEWEKAWRFASMTNGPTGWFVPKLLRADGSACIIRFSPRTAQFSSDAAKQVEDAIATHRGSFKNVRVFSRAAGIGTAADRDAINVTFGVQFARAVLSRVASRESNDTSWRTAAGVKLVAEAPAALRFNKRIRSCTTVAAWVKYYWTVCAQTEREAEVPRTDQECAAAIDFAFTNGIVPLVSTPGDDAAIDVTTDAELSDNADLHYYMQAVLQEKLKVETSKSRKPTFVSPLKPTEPEKPR